MGKHLGRLVILLLVFGSASAQNKYYFSNSGSNAGGGTIGSPWQTLAKLNTVNLQPGDSVLLNGGQTFSSTGFVINQSGSFGNPIKFGSYGTGKGRITGMTDLATWTNEGSNIWSSPLSAGGFEPVVTMYGNSVAPGRTPNTGWQTISSYSGSNPLTITGNLPASPSYVGGYVAIKVEDWIITNNRITAHSGSNITAYHGPYGPPRYQSGYGYFVQHHPSTLDQQNEWYYDSTAAKLKVYSTTSPASFGVRAATATNIIALTQNYITFSNIIFDGAKGNIIEFVNDRTGIKFSNCEFYYAGLNGIFSIFATDLTVEDCKFKWINNNGIVAILGGAKTIRRNNLSQIGMIVGSAVGFNQAAEGMYIEGNGIDIRENRLDSIGYNGISYSGRNVLIENNFVTNFTLKATDGGAFYTGDYHAEDTNVIVRNNIALYGEGERSGTPYSENGGAAAYYVDEFRHNVQFYNNVGAYVKGRGIYLHKAPYITMRGNTLYNNYEQLTTTQDFTSAGPDAQDTRHNIATNNILFAKASRDIFYYFYTPMPDVISLFYDTLNFNILAKPLGLENTILTHNFDPPYQDRSLNPTTFKSLYAAQSYDAASTGGHVRFNSGAVRLEVNSTLSPKKVRIDTAMFDIRGNRYVDSMVVPAFDSRLIASDTTSAKPVANAGIDKTVNLPTTTSTLSGSGSDADGTITYAWSQISGTTATITSPTSATSGVTGLTTTGIRVFQLAVTDNYGYVRRDTMQVTVTAVNIAPTANAGADQVVNVDMVSLVGSGTDSDGTIVSYAWVKLSGTGGTITTPNSQTTTVTGLTYGTYTYQLTVTDNSGATATDVVSIRYNRPPTVDAGANATITLPTATYQLLGSASDADGTYTLAWTKLSGGTYTITNANVATPFVSALSVGTYVFRLTVTDNNGAITTDDVTLTVLPAVVAPTPTAVKVPGIYKIKEKP